MAARTQLFHPVIEAWLARRFVSPTAAQAEAWPLIASGADVLVTAPTGSGKTLTAFLSCLDGLLRDSLAGGLEDRTRVLYVSPLKALSNDIRVNLEQPLGEMAALAEELGYGRPEIRTAVRTGDTTARERRAAIKRPPHVLVTTPESLYILLTSESGRKALRDVRTVIIDEIHAVARDKRGAHLALSIERLEALVNQTTDDGAAPAPNARGLRFPQRIGLSATVNPIDVAGGLLCGTGRPAPQVVNVSPRRDLDLGIELPRDELGAVCTNEQWAEIYDRLAELVRSHRSTLVFVNTRRLVERVAHRLAERLGEEHVAAHHGSLSRERRHKAETRLKAGDLRVVVATASLELGIDVGAVNLTCLVGSPRSIATGLQRIGRSGHVVGGTPKGRLFPLTRDQLVESVALVRAARRGVIDRIALRDAPLDVLGQQIVAACSCEEWDEDALFDMCRHAAQYGNLAREQFDAVVDMMSEGIATSRGRAGALLHRDAVNHRLRGRRGARLSALTSGGAIPDNANYDVVLEPEGTLVGNLDEDFAIESMAGDIILLGNNSWRIRRVEAGRVRVEDAHGAPPTVPFWLGEGPARTPELSAEVAAVRESALPSRNEDGTPVGVDPLDDPAVDARTAQLVRDYLAAGKASLGSVPTERRVIAERFFDEAGGMQLVLHAPFGGRINRAWGTALRKRFCRSFDFELQAAATDDGLVLSLGAQHSFPLETVFQMLRPDDVDELLTQASVQAPMFETRWRWNAMRALALLRHRGGKRVPPAIQRMRAQDLIAAVFPGQTACQDNHGGGGIEIPDHPLVSETIRDCLTEAMDAAGLKVVLADLRSGKIEAIARELPEPSVFAHEILNANPYAFLDDAPLEERRTRAVTLRRGLPAEVVEHLGTLDPERIDEVVAEAQPDPRGPDELHDLLLDLGGAPVSFVEAQGWNAWAQDLAEAGRAAVLGGETSFWVAAERRSLAETVWPGRGFTPDVVEPPPRRPRPWSERDGALAEVVRGHIALTGPTTAARLAHLLDLPTSDIDGALAKIELEGNVLRGHFDARLASKERSVASPREANGGAGDQSTPAGRATSPELQRSDRSVASPREANGGAGDQSTPAGRATSPELQRSDRSVASPREANGGAGDQSTPAGRATSPELQWSDRRLLARINRRMLDGLRRAIEPATAADYMRFLLAWQHVTPSGRLEGRAGLQQILTQLQGFESAAGAWERDILPVRVNNYDPAWLDTLCLSGEIAWGRLVARDGASAPSRVAPIALVRRRDLQWLLATRDNLDDAQLSPAARDVLQALRTAGASFIDDIVHDARRLRGEVEDALWELVGAGRVTGDGFGGLRGLVSATGARNSGRARWVSRWSRGRRGSGAGPATGRWAVLRAPAETLGEEETTEALARQYLRRYGVVLREVLAREPHAPTWRDLLRVYRRLEMRGEIRGGRLVAGFVGEQFALPDALEALRATRKDQTRDQVVRLSACDPLNLAGIITPGERVPATLSNTILLRDGVPAPAEEAATTAGPKQPSRRRSPPPRQAGLVP